VGRLVARKIITKLEAVAQQLITRMYYKKFLRIYLTFDKFFSFFFQYALEAFSSIPTVLELRPLQSAVLV